VQGHTSRKKIALTLQNKSEIFASRIVCFEKRSSKNFRLLSQGGNPDPPRAFEYLSSTGFLILREP
jgi:hypothetical protein